MLYNSNASRLFALLAAVVETAWIWRASRHNRALPNLERAPAGPRDADDTHPQPRGRADEDRDDVPDDIRRAWQSLWRKLDERDGQS
jgi:hypothetical protein